MRWRPLLGLLAGLLVAALFVAAAERFSPHLPGAAGEVYRANRAHAAERDPSALFYTEVGDVRVFLRACED